MTRRKGTGSRYSLSDSRHEIKWWDGGKRHSRIVRGTAAEADRILDDVVATVHERDSYTRGVILTKYAEATLDRLEIQGYASIDAARSRWRKHLATWDCANLPMVDITRRHIRQLRHALERKGLAPRTVRLVLMLLSTIWREAIEDEVADHNPVRDVAMPKVSETRRERILSLDEIQALVTAEGVDEPTRWIALSLAGTGLRPGELLALELEDVHADDPHPHLLVRRSKRSSRRASKTDRGRRVELFGLGLVAVRSWLNLRPALQLPRHRARYAFGVPANWLRARSRFGDLMAAVGVVDIHPHDLRGTCATHLLSGSWGHAWTIAEVAAHLGDSIATTEKHYGHVTGGRLRETASRTGRFRVDEMSQPQRNHTKNQGTSNPRVGSSNLSGRASEIVDEFGDADRARRLYIDRLARAAGAHADLLAQLPEVDCG